MAIVEVDHVSKEFSLGQLQGLKEGIRRVFGRLYGAAAPAQKPFKALDDVSFTVEQGEVLGIIGQNGAGKSTLLKLLARISGPTRGRIVVRGSVAPLIEVGAGLVPDLTGRENVYLNGMILGLRRAEIRRRFDEIVAFSELEEFIDTPVKRYSSGMQVRLGFSIATSVDAAILIVDEVLAVGDLAFQRKCFDRMEELINGQDKTVLLVSHNIRQVERLCSRAILLDHGRIVADGKPAEVCNLYFERSDQKIRADSRRFGRERHKRFRSSGDVEILKVVLLNEAGEPTDRIRHNDQITVAITYRSHIELRQANFWVGVHTTDFFYLATHSSEERMPRPDVASGVFTVQCRIRRTPLLPGVYSIRVGVQVGELRTPLLHAESVLQFRVEADSISRAQAIDLGFVSFDADWKIGDVEPPSIGQDLPTEDVGGRL
ncbi:MAG TPA: ABC transporter ATP-binding protein [Casimicrobiaceae bacterium]|nr:ABC transporter ATP-binding protein [Casimicrobiaceae bacterium]